MTATLQYLSALYCATALPLQSFIIKDPNSPAHYSFGRKYHTYVAAEFKSAYRIPAKNKYWTQMLAHILDIYGPTIIDDIEIESWYVDWLFRDMTQPVPASIKNAAAQRELRLSLLPPNKYTSYNNSVLVRELDAIFEQDLADPTFIKRSAVIREILLTKNVLKVLRQQVHYLVSGLDLFEITKNIESSLQEAFLQSTFYQKNKVLLQLPPPSKKAYFPLTFTKTINNSLYMWVNTSANVAFKAHTVEEDTLVLQPAIVGRELGFESELASLAKDLNNFFIQHNIKGPQGNVLKVTYI